MGRPRGAALGLHEVPAPRRGLVRVRVRARVRVSVRVRARARARVTVRVRVLVRLHGVPASRR